MASLLEKDLVSAEIAVENGAVVFKPVGQPGTGSVEGKYVNWLSFKGVENSVREDIARIKSHSLINKSIPITGYVYDVKTGKLIRVD